MGSTVKETVEESRHNPNMSNFVQSFDQEYNDKKETGKWNRKGLNHTKKEEQANRQLKIFQKEEPVRTYKDSSTPSVKYTIRKYKKCEARKECNQSLESFKSEFEVLKYVGVAIWGHRN